MNKYNPKIILQSGRVSVCTCEEKGRKFILKNKSNIFLIKIKVDGGLITQGERCDFAIDTESEELFLIELKGSDKPHACDQIYTTFNYILRKLDFKKCHARIILSKDRVPNLISNEEKRLIHLKNQRKNFDYLIRNVRYEENI